MHVEAILKSAFNREQKERFQEQLSKPLPLLSVAYFPPKYMSKAFYSLSETLRYKDIMTQSKNTYDAIPCYTLVVNDLVSLPHTVSELRQIKRNTYFDLMSRTQMIIDELKALGCDIGIDRNSHEIKNDFLPDGELNEVCQFIVTLPIFKPHQEDGYIGTRPNEKEAEIFYRYLKDNNICSQKQLDAVFTKRVQFLAHKSAMKL